MEDEVLWSQFRRLLLGTVVEGLLAEGVAVSFGSIAVAFDEDSAFRVPRFDNSGQAGTAHKRFRGRLTATLETPIDPVQLGALQARLRTIWPELLAVVDLPIGDKLTSSRHELLVDATAEQLVVRFDLEAD